MKKNKVVAALLAAAMVFSMSACSKKDDETEKTKEEKETTEKVESESDESAEETTTAEASESETETEAETTPAAGAELTKEQYDAMTEDELIEMAGITDRDNVTMEQYVWLVNTLKFAEIKEDKGAIWPDAQSITRQALNHLKKGLPADKESKAEEFITSPEPAVRYYGYGLLESLTGVTEDDVKMAVSHAKDETEPMVLCAAISALANDMKTPEVAEFIFTMSHHEVLQVRSKSMTAIGNTWSIGVPGTTERLIEVMNDKNEDEYVRGMACHLCGQLHDEALVEPLKAILFSEEEDDKLKGEAARGLMILFYDSPFNEHTSEAAWNVLKEYYSATPRTNTNPQYLALNDMTKKSSSNYDAWKEMATFFDIDEFYNIMVDIIKDENALGALRTCAVDCVKAQCSDEKFVELGSVVDSLTDDGAQKVVDEYQKKLES